jgi:penicillin amidase
MRLPIPSFPFLLFALALLGCSSTPSAEGAPDSLRLPVAAVEIFIDDAGIPHIYAESDEDLFFGYGYQLATDRMLQIEMFRRFAHGRLSEVLGSGGPGSVGDTALQDDRFARIFNWRHHGRLDAQLMAREDPSYHALMRAWVAGINARVADIHSGKVERPWGFGAEGLDREPEAWTDDDPYIIRKMTQFGLDQTIEYEVFVTFATRYAPQTLEAIQLFKPAHPVYIMPPEERPATKQAARHGGMSTPSQRASHDSSDMAPRLASLGRLSEMKPLGSNSWSIDGRHTASGKPIIAGDRKSVV